jgi:mono/diheme cytochrome c family protein
MTEAKRRLVVMALAVVVLLSGRVSPALAQVPSSSSAPPQPFAPEWATLTGGQLFGEKHCGKCHTVRGAGGSAGPDLSKAPTGSSFFDIGAAMWNHLPRMGAKMRQEGIERARLTPTEAGNLVAFLFTAQYFDDSGDAKRGESLFRAKSCAVCHSVGGRGGTEAPVLDPLKRANSPVLVAAAMWNHAPAMNEAFKRMRVPRPSLDGKELLDIVAYVVATSSDTTGDTQQVIPGTPERGRTLFNEKKCAACHAVAGNGPKIGPDLGRAGHHISLTAFAARMWNHAPAMLAKMSERKIEPPKLTGQETADILAYLFTSRYFEPTGNARRGADLVQSKGCLGCHSAAGKGAKGGIDFARSSVVGTPAALVASMWNHGRAMEAEAEKRQLTLPELRGAELADISAYLVSVSRVSRRTPSDR